MDGVIRALQEFWKNEVDSRPWEPGTRIDHRVDPEHCLLDVFSTLNLEFGLRFKDRGWMRFPGLANALRSMENWNAWAESNFTFAHLAEFIRGRLPNDPVWPVNLLGRPCLPAGAFERVQREVQAIGCRKRFGPSSSIASVLSSSKRQTLLYRCLVWAPSAFPRCASKYETNEDRVLLLSGISVAIGAVVGLYAGTMWLFVVGAVAVLIAAAVILANQPSALINAEVRTFRDLSLRLAGASCS